MHTLNVRQLRSLALIAPGTLALRDESTFAQMQFLTTAEDAARCGWWMLTIDREGDGWLAHTADRGGHLTRFTYDELMRREREAVLEAEAELSEFVKAVS